MVEAKLVKGTMTRKILHDILDKELDKYLELLLKASPYEVTRTASEQSAIANFFLVGKVSDDVDWRRRFNYMRRNGSSAAQ